MPKKVLIMVMVDAMKYGKVNASDAPFIQSLKSVGVSGPMVETFAFQTRPAYLAGLTPEKCEVANLFYYAPEESPFGFTRYFPIPDRLYMTLLKIPKVGNGIRRILRYWARRHEARMGNTASQHYAYPEEIPYSLLHHFAYSEKRLITEPSVFRSPTLFDLLRESEQRWLWIAYPTHEQRAHQILSSFEQEFTPDSSLIYLHFSETDWAGHAHGPDSPEYSQALRRIDEALRHIGERVSRHYDEVSWLIYGDHGMVEVDTYVNVEALLDRLPIRRDHDYHYFLDSTQARFWVQNASAKSVLIEGLKTLDGGQVLSEQQLSDLHFRFRHNKFGDIIFQTFDRTIVFPNFFQSHRPVKGMHGYLPDVVDNMAEFVITGPGVVKATISTPVQMVDIFPTACSLLSLTPPPGRYHSILERDA